MKIYSVCSYENCMESNFKVNTKTQHKYMYNNTRVEVGSNTSTVTLQVVRGNEMGLKKAAP
jgi:hypothetical protein